MDQGLKQLNNFDVKSALTSANEKLEILKKRHENEETQSSLPVQQIWEDAELLRWTFKVYINFLASELNLTTIPSLAKNIMALIERKLAEFESESVPIELYRAQCSVLVL